MEGWTENGPLMVHFLGSFIQEIKDVIRKQWHILTSDPVGAILFAEPPLFSHYRATKIKDILVKFNTFARNRREGCIGDEILSPSQTCCL